MDEKRFAAACLSVLGSDYVRSGIGTLKERALHLVLKRYFEPREEYCEKRVGRYVADIENEDGIIEVQTRSLNALRPKLTAFLPQKKVTVVYPIAHTKHICWVDDTTGEITKRRKSPKTGSIYDAFGELYKIKQFLTDKNLRICLVLIDLTEYRRLDGWSHDKKKGSTRAERVPCGICGEYYIDDFSTLIPPLEEPFTSASFAAAAKINRRWAQTALNILNFTGSVKRVGKEKNMYLYCKTCP